MQSTSLFRTDEAAHEVSMIQKGNHPVLQGDPISEDSSDVDLPCRYVPVAHQSGTTFRLNLTSEFGEQSSTPELRFQRIDDLQLGLGRPSMLHRVLSDG